MKHFKSYFCCLLIALILCNSFPISAEQAIIIDSISTTSSTTTSSKNIQADTYEITTPFSTPDEHLQYLRTKNTAHTTDDLKHETIQAVLKERGVLGLSKYQYHQILTEEKPLNLKKNELLIRFNHDNAYFFQDSYEQLFESFIDKKDYFLGVLIGDCSSDELISLIGKLIYDPYVDFIQPSFVYEYNSSAYVTADYTYSLTRAMEQVNATSAWNYYTGQGVVVGMIDSGVDVDSCAQLHNNNHCEGDINSYCSVPNCIGHGTAVASIIGGNAEFSGVAPGCTILCYSLGHNHENETSSDISPDPSLLYDAVEALKNCKIINISMSFSELDTFFKSKLLLYSNILFVHSAGNTSTSLDNLGTYNYYDNSNYIRVASVDMNDDLSWFSNYGQNKVHIAAPGENLSIPTKDGELRSTYENENNDPDSGTSFAAPFVSGTAALLLEANPNLTAAQLKTKILNTADNVPSLTTSVNQGRRLNVMAAVSSVNPPTGERYAYITSGGALYARDNSFTSPQLIASNVKNAQLGPKGILYQTTNNYLYCRPGALNSASVLIDGTGDVVSYSASWSNLVVYNNDNTLDRYIYSFSNSTPYMYDVTHRNVLKYALSGNRLVLFYSNSAKFRIYENIQMYSNYEIYPVNGTIDSLWVAGTRLHVYQNNGIYQLFDSVSNTKPAQHHDYEPQNEVGRKWLSCVYSDTDFSYNTSMNEYRWCTAEGASLYVYGFYGDGQMEYTPDVRTDANGQTITNCKIIDYRVYYTVGTAFYAYEGDSSAPLYLLDVPISTFVCCGDNVGIIDQNDGKFKVKNGELTATWNTVPGAVNPKAIYVSY